MHIEILNSDFTIKNGNNYDYIIHISDLHIRLQSRKEEYEEVFKRLYDKIDNYKNENGLIVVTGDILHDKTSLTPEAIKLCLELFKNLSKRLKTIVIPGNHDGLVNINERDDNISGVLYDKDIENLHYFKYSGIYKFNNIVFGICSIYDNNFINSNYVDTYIKNKGLKDMIKICLYHGMVGIVELEGLYKAKGKLSIHEFDGYDYVLLGDVHKYQYLNENKTIAYASSLISQNFAETDPYHGYLFWDLKNKSSHYEIIKNDYCYKKCFLNENILNIDNLNFNLKNDEDLEKLKTCIPLYGQIKIMSEYEESNEMLKFLKNKFKKVKWTEMNNLIINKGKKEEKLLSNMKIDIKELIKEQIYKTHKIHLDNSKIDFIYNDITSKIKNRDKIANSWELISIQFDNLCIYGENNIIDLKKFNLNEVILISGRNNTGKSSIIDIICFILYNKMGREMNIKNKIANEILNINKKTGYGELIIKLGEKIFVIKRDYKRSNGKISISSFFYELIDDKRELLLNTSELVNKKINEIFGAYDDFLFMNMILQFDNVSFRYMKQNDRKELLNRLLDLDKYENIEDLIKPIYKDYEEKYKKLLNYIENVDIEDLKLKIIKNNDDLNKIKEDLSYSEKKRNSLMESINEFNKNYVKIDDKKIENYKNEIKNIKIVEEEKKDIDNKIKIIEDKIKEYEMEKDNLKLINNKNILVEYYEEKKIDENNLEELNKKIEELLNNKKALYEIDVINIDSLNNDIKEIEEKLIKISTVELEYEKFIKEYDDILIQYNSKYENHISLINNYKNEMKILIIPDDKITKKEYKNKNNVLIDLFGKMNNEYERINNEINDIKSKIEMEDYDKLQNEYDIFLKEKDELLNFEKELLMKNKILKELSLHEYNPNCLQCIKNPKVKELLKMTTEIKDLEKLINEFNIDKNIEVRKKEYDLNNKLLYEKYIEKNKIDNEIIRLKDEISDNEKCIQYINFEIKIELENNKWENESIIRRKDNYEKDKNERLLKIDHKKILENELVKLINILDIVNKNDMINLENKMVENNLEILKNEIKKIKGKIYEKYEDYMKEENRNNEIMYEINKLNNDYKELSKKLFKEECKLNELKDKETEVCNSLMINDKNIMILAKIDLLKIELKQYDNEYHRLEIEKYKIEKDNIEINNKIDNYETKKDEYYEVIQKKEIYEYYVELVHKNGLSLSIINKYINYISDGVNQIIEPFLNKSIELNIDGSNIILNINVKDDTGKGQSVLMLGGRESFIFDTAFKIILSKISEMPRSNFLFIDEGLSVFDKENLTNIKELLDYLNTFFDHVFLMSHIDIIKDMVDNKIYIKKEGDYSKICE